MSDLIFLSKRLWYTPNSTISEVFVGNEYQCFFLEDPVREVKVPGKTAIPYGRYEIVTSFSNRFQTMLPLLLNVPNFEGVRIHPGNTPGDTEGCLLPGLRDPKAPDVVTDSRRMFNLIFARIKTGLESGKVFIDIVDGRVPSNG